MFRHRTLAELRAALARPAERRAIVGFDGFVDTIVAPVGLRRGQGENFSPIATIPEFAQRIASAAGKSANYEFYPRFEKLGGNAPIMAGALAAAGSRGRARESSASKIAVMFGTIVQFTRATRFEDASSARNRGSPITSQMRS